MGIRSWYESTIQWTQWLCSLRISYMLDTESGTLQQVWQAVILECSLFFISHTQGSPSYHILSLKMFLISLPSFQCPSSGPHHLLASEVGLPAFTLTSLKSILYVLTKAISLNKNTSLPHLQPFHGSHLLEWGTGQQGHPVCLSRLFPFPAQHPTH